MPRAPLQLQRCADQGRYEGRKSAAWAAFEEWAGFKFLADEQDPDRFIDKVVEYGQVLYDEDAPRYKFECALSRLAEVHPQWNLKVAWRALRRWEIMEPAATRLPVPPLVFFAFLGLALYWNAR